MEARGATFIMTWEGLIGQQPAKNYLSSVLGAKRLGHAYLFKGPAGVGKRTAARAFAKTLLCHHALAPDEACGHCKSCHWFATPLNASTGSGFNHPDMINLIQFSGGAVVTEKLVSDHEPIIKLETIQYICEQLHRSPMAGSRRVVIIPEAQRLCRGQAESANALLKTLEEPPETSVLLLTSSQPQALLETILSRVQTVQFRRLSVHEIRDGLAAKGHPSEKTEMVVAVADGSLGHALELLEGDLMAWRDAVVKTLEVWGPASCPQFGLALSALAEVEGKRLFQAEKESEKAGGDQEVETTDALNGEGNETEIKTEAGWRRYVFKRLLELCEICFRDGLVWAASDRSNPDLLLQPDQLKLSESLAKKFGEEGCQMALLALREGLYATRLYVRSDVVGRALAGKFVEAQRHY